MRRLSVVAVVLLLVFPTPSLGSGRPYFDDDLVLRYPKLALVQEWIDKCVARHRVWFHAVMDPNEDPERRVKLKELMLNQYYIALYIVGLLSLPEGTVIERASATALIRQCAE